MVDQASTHPLTQVSCDAIHHAISIAKNAGNTGIFATELQANLQPAISLKKPWLHYGSCPATGKLLPTTISRNNRT